MSFLFDENLSWRLVKRLSDIYPASQHARDLGLKSAPDEVIWERAKRLGRAIVSKDDDFRQRALVFGSPPKTIWVRIGNASTDEIEKALRSQFDVIRAFLDGGEESILIVQAS